MRSSFRRKKQVSPLTSQLASASPLAQGKPLRLNRLIALMGSYSRRAADELIKAGKVTVNGKRITEPGLQVEPKGARIHVNGKLLQLEKFRLRYVLFHKPSGCITTRSDEQGRKTIYDYLPSEFKAYDPAGRLDRKSTGLLLLSNDGDLLHQLTHPSSEIDKVYRVDLEKPISNPDALANALLEGVFFEEEGKLAKVEEVLQLGPSTLELCLHTGYNRQIRRMLEQLGYPVLRLKRISVGSLTLSGLKPGDHRFLKTTEVLALKKQLTTKAKQQGKVRPNKGEPAVAQKAPGSNAPQAKATPRKKQAVTPAASAKSAPKSFPPKKPAKKLAPKSKS